MWVSKLKLGLVGLGHTPTLTGRLPDDLGSFELAIVNLGEEPSRLAETVRRIQAAGLPIVAPDLGEERWLELMQVDKKNEGGHIKFILIKPLGTPLITTVAQESLLATLKACVRTE